MDCKARDGAGRGSVLTPCTFCGPPWDSFELLAFLTLVSPGLSFPVCAWRGPWIEGWLPVGAPPALTSECPVPTWLIRTFLAGMGGRVAPLQSSQPEPSSPGSVSAASPGASGTVSCFLFWGNHMEWGVREWVGPRGPELGIGSEGRERVGEKVKPQP